MVESTGESNFELPVLFVIGAARSGTTLLGEKLLGAHSDVVYWGEPNHIWRKGSIRGDSERRTERDATPKVANEIREAFSNHFARQEGEILVEKTPSNCLRIPFMKTIFPQARFIHLVRDGRDVAISARKQWKGGTAVDDIGTGSSVFEELVEWLSTLRREVRGRAMWRTLNFKQLPYYVGRALTLLWSRLTGAASKWGPRVPELAEISKEYSLLETCALQWKICVDTVLSDWEEISATRRTEVRYETLVTEPYQTLERILDFADLEVTPTVERQIREISSDRVLRWKECLDAEDRQAIESLIGDTLQAVGYELSLN